MANHKSALKRAKQNENRQMRNKTVKTRVKNIVKDVRLGSAEAGKDTDDRFDRHASVTPFSSETVTIWSHPHNRHPRPVRTVRISVWTHVTLL